jgi:hypothetical protein
MILSAKDIKFETFRATSRTLYYKTPFMRRMLLICLLCAATALYASEQKNIVSHLVRPHETAFRISLLYNSTVEDIVHENPGMKADKVRSGAVIRVPRDTKMRDAAFVDALLHGKRVPVHNAAEAEDVAEAQAAPMPEVENENPFMAPKKKGKTIEQMERESALENNVPQKVFAPAHSTVQASNMATQKSNDVTSKNEPLPLSLFDKQIELLINGQDPSTARPDRPAAPPVKPTVAAPAMIDDDCSHNTNTVPATPDNTSKQNAATCEDKAGTSLNRNAEIMKQIGILLDANQIISINLQIVMKDGTVKTITSPDEQRKALSQLVSP